ncbi:MAG: NUDIX domain-containing protein [Anaerolineales bacterium]|nr:NUDIX domain-containing protein [Anaerolineales bacterium]
MVLHGQRVQPNRYTIIPRTLTFLLRRDQVLLIKIAEGRAGWSGKLNGIGGHIEAGEDALSSARREVIEETGLTPIDLQLVGVVQIDTGATPGVGLYVFTGKAPNGKLIPGPEGTPEWVSLAEITSRPLVADLPMLIPAALKSEATRTPFSALTTFDEYGNPHVQFTAP